MITAADARTIAAAYVENMSGGPHGIELVLVQNETIEQDFGWVVFYDSKAFLDTHDDSEMIAGNAPFIVDRHSGAVTVLGTAKPVATYIDTYRRFGTPFPRATSAD